MNLDELINIDLYKQIGKRGDKYNMMSQINFG